MSQIQKECFVCHEQVYLSKPTPDSKWVKTNLDGSAHVDPEKPRTGSRQQQQTVQLDTPLIQESKITANLRTEAIAKAHEENMQASERLAKSIDGLSSNVATLIDLFGKYLDTLA